MMRVISFCTDGIRKAAKAGLYDWLQEQDADFICLQNLRAREEQLGHPVFYPDGYHPYFFDSASGHNGVAIYSRQLPKAIMTGVGLGAADAEARYIQADFAALSVVSLLAPTADSLDAEPFARRMAFLDQLQANLDKVRNKRRDYILCASLGLAHTADDLEMPAGMEAVPGYSDEERRWFDALTGPLEYVDAFRCVNSDPDEFTWQRELAGRTSGWRSDYQLVSGNLERAVEYGMIYKRQSFGSHAPLIIDYDIDLDGSAF